MSLTIEDVNAQLQKTLDFLTATTQKYADWSAGTYNGGVAGDGKYPLPIGLNADRQVACPARTMYDAQKQQIIQVNLASGNTYTVDFAQHNQKILYLIGPAANINVTVLLPWTAEVGSQVGIIQRGTGKFPWGSTNSGVNNLTATFRNSQGAAVHRAQWSCSTAICVEKFSNGVAAYVFVGDLVVS
jgi:hypothetical protein